MYIISINNLLPLLLIINDMKVLHCSLSFNSKLFQWYVTSGIDVTDYWNNLEH